MKISGISREQFNLIQKIINNISNVKFRDLCNISKNQHILFYNGEYSIHPPLNSGEHRSAIQKWSAQVPALKNIDSSLAQIIAKLIFEEAEYSFRKIQNASPIRPQPSTNGSSQFLPENYVSQQLDKKGRDISILDILEMSDQQISGNRQLMQYKAAIGTIMNLSSKYLNTWALGVERPIELSGSKMQHKFDPKMSKQLLQAKNKLRSKFDDEEIDRLLSMLFDSK